MNFQLYEFNHYLIHSLIKFLFSNFINIFYFQILIFLIRFLDLKQIVIYNYYKIKKSFIKFKKFISILRLSFKFNNKWVLLHIKLSAIYSDNAKLLKGH